jgi:hypothetical protein
MGRRKPENEFDETVEDYLTSRLGAGVDLAGIREGILERFAEGVAPVCERDALGYLNRVLTGAGLTPKEIAAFIGRDRATVSRVLSGKVALSYRALSLALTALARDLAEVDFPTRDDRINAGFLEAMPYLRWQVLKDPHPGPAGGRLTEAELLRLDRLLRPDRLPGEDPESDPRPDDQVLVAEWGAAYFVCLWALQTQIPPRYLDR